MAQDNTSRQRSESHFERAPIFLCPLRNAIIRLGVATIDAEFKPKGDPSDTHSLFVQFPEPFPDREIANVRLIITNRNHPQVVGSATTTTQDGVQGFILTGRNTVEANATMDGASAKVDRVSFSWIAVLPTNQVQEPRFDVRFGLIPFREYREFPNSLSFTFPETNSLFADAPMSESGGEKFVFLTTTVSGAANAAAATATTTGIPEIVAHQTGHREGGCRLHWLVISQSAEQTEGKEINTSDYFNSDDLWIHAARGEPVRIDGRAWEHRWMKFAASFRERSPCVFATANAHGVKGHLAGAVPMSWHCKRDSYVVKYRSFDTLEGEANFDAIAIGHCDASPEVVEAANRNGQPTITAWERFIESGFDAPEYVRNKQIGPNEFHQDGGSLLFHVIYEDQVCDFQELLDLGADVNQQHPLTRARPLHIAATYDREEITETLLEQGADVNATTVDGTESIYPPRWKLYNQFRPFRGETALHLAVYYRHFKIARLLLAAGANPNAEDSHGDRPIDYLPWWHTFPDNLVHWRLLNERCAATAADYVHIFDWILEEEERYKN